MSLRQQMSAALQKLGAGAGAQRLEVHDGGQTLAVDLESAETLACSVWEISLTAPRLSQAAMADLQRAAQELSQRVRYLLEPISPIETDAEGCQVQMRSNPPHKDDDGTTYYELLVQRGGIALRRWHKSPESPRESIPAQLTREVLLRLTDDFAAVAG